MRGIVEEAVFCELHRLHFIFDPAEVCSASIPKATELLTVCIVHATHPPKQKCGKKSQSYASCCTYLCVDSTDPFAHVEQQDSEDH